MAIIDSIALGKSKGSIGNVTFYQLNGQTVARYRNTTPADPKTIAQLNQRLGMKNTTKAFYLMKGWAKGMASIKVGKQTYYNRYTSIMINYFQKVNYSTTLDILKGVLGGGAPVGNSIYVFRPELLETEIRVPFDTNGLAWESGWMIQLGVINDSENSFDYVGEYITLSDWTNKYIDLPIIGSVNYKTFCYAYNAAAKKMSDISFQYLLTPTVEGAISNLKFMAGGVEYFPIPTFDYTTSGFYDIYIPETAFTVTFDWVHPGDEHYVIYQDNAIEVVNPNSYTLPNNRPMSEFVIDVLPPLSEEIQYVIRVHKI